jgi:FKBP-type peptidyl-prolyl cis-trans isomerase (trigger factor)
MQTVKRMVLVDERLYDQLWKRTPLEASKSDLSNKLESQLNSIDVPDDIKVKQYQQTLNRFLNQKQQQELPVVTPPLKRKITRLEPPRKRAKWAALEDIEAEPRRSKRTPKPVVRWSTLDG